MKTIISAAFLLLSFISNAATLDVDPSGTYMSLPCFSTIQAAINASSNGDVIAIHSGTYQENLIVDKQVTLLGDGPTTIIEPAISNIGDPANQGSAYETATNIVLIKASNVTITNLTIDGSNPLLAGGTVVNGVSINARNGIINDFNHGDYDRLIVDNIILKNIFERGIQVGRDNTVPIGNVVQNCTIDNVDGNQGSYGVFSYWSDIDVIGNTCTHATLGSNWGLHVNFISNRILSSWTGISCQNVAGGVLRYNIINSGLEGSFGIYIYQAETSVTVDNNTIQDCSYGIAVMGSYSSQNVDLIDNTINGFTGAVPAFVTSIGLYTSTEVPGYAPGNTINVTMSGNNAIQNVETGVLVESSNETRPNIGDPVSGTASGAFVNNTRLSGMSIFNISGNYIKLKVLGSSSVIPNIDATTVAFDTYGTSLADGFAIEDKILHKMDDPLLGVGAGNGLVTFMNKEIFVTGNTGNTLVQRAVDNAPADGWRINIKNGPAYPETVTINKAIRYRSDFVNTFNGVVMNASGKALTLESSLSLSNSLDLTSGIINTGSNTLSLQNGILLSGGSDASHVNGTLEKIGNTTFTFPVGNGTIYRPCSISAPAVATDAYSVQYFNASARTSVTPGAIVTAGTPAMLSVSGNEYWNILRTAGSSDVAIGLTWKDDPTSGAKSSDNDFVVASNSGSGWSNLGSNPTNVSGLLWITSPAPTTQYGSFALGSVVGSVTLPLNFTSFTGQQTENGTLLKWSILFDRLPKSFNILRSKDGGHFEIAGTLVPGTNSNANYQFIDKNSSGYSFYKIEAIEQTNRKIYSGVINLGINRNNNLNIICNNQQFMNIPVNEDLLNKTYINVVTIDGKIIQTIKVTSNVININVQIPGSYLFLLVNNRGNVIGKARTTVLN